MAINLKEILHSLYYDTNEEEKIRRNNLWEYLPLRVYTQLILNGSLL